MSDKARLVLEKAKEIYELYFQNLNKLRITKFKIQTWDAGWWQVRNALSDENIGNQLFTDLAFLHKNLKESLLPKIYEYKFLIR